jgi:Ger(x)C family germination protein
MLAIISTTFGGCFNYRDINRVVFVTALVVDIDKDGSVILYTENFRPFRGSGQSSERGQRVIFKGKGKSLFEAIRDTNLSSSYKINYTQNRAIIITEKAAEYGINKFIDFIDRDQELLIRSYIYVFQGEPEKLMKLQLKEEEYIGTYLSRLIENVGASSRAVHLTLNEFLTRRRIGSKTDVITLLKINENALEDKLKIDGGAIIDDDTIVGILPKEENQGYNFLTNRVKLGTLEVTNPSYEDQYITLEILNSSTKTKLSLEDNKIKIKKYIKVKTTIGEVQEGINITNETLKEIEGTAERNIKKYSTKLFEEYKNKGIDIFHVEEELYESFPHVKYECPIRETELEVIPKVTVEGSSNRINFH